MAGKSKSGRTTTPKNTKPKRGAKSKYTDEFPEIAEKLAKKGLSDKQIASGLNISLDTFYSYKKQFPKFSDAIKRGKGPVDEKAENALYRRALGYFYDEKTVEKTVGPNGTWTKERTTRKHIPADVGALHTWLFNRKPEEWKPVNAAIKTEDLAEIPILSVEEVPYDDDIAELLEE